MARWSKERRMSRMRNTAPGKGWLTAVVVGLWLVPSASMAHEHQGEKVRIPSTASGILKELSEHEELVGKRIAEGKLEQVHEIAFEIRDLVNALPDASKDLSEDARAELKADARFVASLAERLDRSGDAGDVASAKANFEKLQGILRRIRALYAGDNHGAAAPGHLHGAQSTRSDRRA
jgi:hypothetical protein